MDVAAFIVAVLALIASTVSLTLQIANRKSQIATLIPPVADPYVNLAPPGAALPMYVHRDTVTPQTPDQLEAEKILNEAELKKIDEMFSNPDVPFTGIDEEFNT